MHIARPSDNTPLTAARAKLVKTHAEWARRGAYKNAAKWSRYVTVDDLMSAAYLGPGHGCPEVRPESRVLVQDAGHDLLRVPDAPGDRYAAPAERCVFDPRVEGGMRTVVQRVDWPTYDDGRPRDRHCARPAAPVGRSGPAPRAAPLAATHHDRRLVRLVPEGHTAVEIARELRVSPKTVANRLEGLTRRIKSRIAAGKAA